MAHDEATRRIALLKLATNRGNLEATGRELHIAPKTLREWRDRAAASLMGTVETLPSTSLDTTESPESQIQGELIASDSPIIPEKQAKVDLISRSADKIWLNVLELAEDPANGKLARDWAVTGGIAIQKLQELVEGRHKQQAQVVEQHLHTGPEYHRAAASNAAKHPKHRRKLS